MAKKHSAAKKDMSFMEVPGVSEVHSAEWGDYNVSFMKELQEVGDFSPLLKGLPDNMCHAPHWGYMFKGKMVMKFKDREETIKAGEAFYMEAPHVPTYTEKGTEYVVFTPKKLMNEVMGVVMENTKKGITAKKP